MFPAGWAATILFNPVIRDQFEAFKNRSDTFSLGVCNGCQLMGLLGWVAADEGTKLNMIGVIWSRTRSIISMLRSARAFIKANKTSLSTLLHSERPKLNGVLAVLSAIGLRSFRAGRLYM